MTLGEEIYVRLVANYISARAREGCYKLNRHTLAFLRDAANLAAIGATHDLDRLPDEAFDLRDTPKKDDDDS